MRRLNNPCRQTIVLFLVLTQLWEDVVTVVSASSGGSASTFGVQQHFPPIAGYHPSTLVTDHNAIDLDIRDMENLFAAGRLDDGMAVYQKGSNTRSYATVRLGMELPDNVPVNALVYANSTGDNSVIVFGKTLFGAKKGATSLSIMYEVNEDPINYVKCRVGANPNPMLEGCFASKGTLYIQASNDYMEIPYSYNPSTDNLNDRAIQTFSSKASYKMKPCNKCEYWRSFDKFYQYYGKPDYADKFIIAAAKGERVTFDSMEADFTNMSLEGRTASIQTAVVAMNIGMYVNRELEFAITQCHNCPPSGCNHDIVMGVDIAAAMYTGSLEGPTGTGEGRLLYAIADRECKYFKTCGPKADSTKGIANVNIKISEHFQIMQQNITNRACVQSRGQMDILSKLMLLPLVQGTLRYAYIRSTKGNDATDEEVGNGFILAASVVPVLAACSYHDAAIVMKNMAIGSTPDFGDVSQAFENHFDCLGIKCKDLGGYWNEKKREYYDGFSPCHFDDPEEEPSHVVFYIFLVILLLSIIFIVYRFCRPKRKRMNKNEEDDDDFSDNSDDSSIHFT